jgi:hypothetical protein
MEFNLVHGPPMTGAAKAGLMVLAIKSAAAGIKERILIPKLFNTLTIKVFNKTKI